ncbi:MAG: NPCBM/NEW2 domain-containing protein [Magnetococcales bacterium]|nr:NPCBM/NEW2 domain-containing protein [Magnetococcales bacterium]
MNDYFIKNVTKEVLIAYNDCVDKMSGSTTNNGVIVEYKNIDGNKITVEASWNANILQIQPEFQAIQPTNLNCNSVPAGRKIPLKKDGGLNFQCTWEKNAKKGEVLVLAHNSSGKVLIKKEIPETVPPNDVIRYLSDERPTTIPIPIHGNLGIDKPYWASSIVIAGKTYQKGLVMHPKEFTKVKSHSVEVVYDLKLLEQKHGVKFKKFRSTIGLAEPNDCSSSDGNVNFIVKLDDKEVYNSRIINNGPVRHGIYLDVNVPIEKAQNLQLIVDDANGSIGCDHATWADARLTTKE